MIPYSDIDIHHEQGLKALIRMPPFDPGSSRHGALVSPALVAAFLENVPDAVFFKDRESRFIGVSASLVAKHNLGLPGSVIGKTDFDFFAEDHARRAFQDERHIIDSGEPLIDKLEKETWADGRVTWALTSKIALRDAAGEVIGILGIVKDVTKAREIELALDATRRDLVEASRLAGMAEVATGVLHNVGNALNSLNVSAHVIASSVRQSRVGSLASLCRLLGEHAADLGAFLTDDPRGRQAVQFLDLLSSHLGEEQSRLLREIGCLLDHIERIKKIVAFQETYTTTVRAVEAIQAESLMEDAARLNSAGIECHRIRLERSYLAVPPVRAERGRAIQILANLIGNAISACKGIEGAERRVELMIEPGASDSIRLAVRDNGVGIATENLVRIFSPEFTTGADGHGVGLHAGALAAREMKGRLTAHSDGPGSGATFALELPKFAKCSV
jgi:PAS domain S-box-containing protein